MPEVRQQQLAQFDTQHLHPSKLYQSSACFEADAFHCQCCCQLCNCFCIKVAAAKTLFDLQTWEAVDV
jgi:hypothetical protein